MDLTECINGSPESRVIQFDAFVVVRMAQAMKDCPWYRVLSKYRLWRGLRSELEAFQRYEEKVKP